MNTTVQRVRALIADGTMTRAGLARAAGLHANTPVSYTHLTLPTKA